MRCAVKFEFGIFISIIILSFLLFYKLTSYLADFKNIKNQSRIEIVFLTIFFIFLFVPMSHINQNETSKTENRTLAKKPLFITETGEINCKYGKEFDSWFNDRFLLRDELLDCYVFINLLNKKLSFGNYYYIKKNNWLGMSYNRLFKTRKDEDISVNYLNSLYDFCNSNNIKLYVLLVPSKEMIYSDELQPFVSKQIIKENKKSIEYIINKSKADIVFPINEIIEEKDKFVFFKTEHHWTQTGAYIGFVELMKIIQKDYQTLKIVSLNNYDSCFDKKVNVDFKREWGVGQTLERIKLLTNYANDILDVDYKYYKNQNENILQEKIFDDEKGRGREYVYPLGYDLKVLQTGTSMNEALDNFLPYQFKNVKYIRLNTGKMKPTEQQKILKYYKDDILGYKPNILIFCITTKNLKHYKEIK